MEHITRRDLFIHAYLNAGYDPDQAIVMADEVIALMAQEKPKETSVSKPQRDWLPEKADDVLYFFRKHNFESTLAFRQHGADLSLIDGKVRIRSKGVGKPMVNVHAYGQTDADHTVDTLVFDVVTPNRGVWIRYNMDYIVGVDFQSGALQRVNNDLMSLNDSFDGIAIRKGDRLILEVKRHHHKVDVYLENHTNGQSCVLRFEDKEIQYEECNTMDFLFSDDVITEIDLCYLDCGLIETKSCIPFEFHQLKEFDWEEKAWFESEAFADEYHTLVKNGQYIAYRKKDFEII